MTKKIEFTNNALEQIKKIVSENKKCNYFRISVKGGGCSGFKYNFELDNNKTFFPRGFTSLLRDNILRQV